jgi:hypothetical protein
LKPLLRKFLKSLGIISGIFLLLYFILLIYVSYNKKSIIEKATADISEKMEGNVTVGDVDISLFGTFPYASVLLKNVEITDTMYAQHRHPFLKAEKLYARLSISRLFKKQFVINGLKAKNAGMYIFTDSTGYSNLYLINKKNKPEPKDNPAPTHPFKSVELENVQLIMDDRLKDKLYDVTIKDLRLKINKAGNAQSEIKTKANVLINSLAFNLSAGSFVKGHTFEGKFNLIFDEKKEQLKFDSIDITISNHSFNLSGTFDLKGPKPQFHFRGHTKQISYDFAKSLVTPKISKSMSIAGFDQKADVDIFMNGPLKGGDPLLRAYWSVKGAHLTTPFFDFDNANFKGFYTNEVVPGLPRRDPNSKIIISDFFATWHDLPVSSQSIEILNLYQPTLTCDLKSAFPLNKLNELLGSNNIILESGDGSVSLTYKGPLIRNNNTNSFINGYIGFINGTINYAPRDVTLKNVNGKLAFRNSNVFVEDLNCEVLKNKITMNGAALNLLTLINTEPDKINIDWNIFSPSLNLASFLYLLKPRKTTTRQRKAAASKFGDVSDKIDAVLDKGKVNVKLTTPNMVYKKLKAKNVNADVLLLQDRYVINNVSMEQAGGTMNLNGSLVTRNNNYHEAAINVDLHNVNVTEVFDEFNNFGQDGIKGDNLSGRLSASVKANMLVNDNGEVAPNSIRSTVNFSLKNGGLINFDPIKKVQDVIFKNRDFENIKFAEIKNKLEIADQEITIGRMEIQSTVLSLFVEGVYSMKGNTDISIQVPLRNLKKRSDDYKPENIGTDAKAGASIYLRGRPGSDGNIQFKPDIFKKFRKS